MEEASTNNFHASTSEESDVLVRVDKVGKRFCRDLKKSLWYGMKDVASELLPTKNSNIQKSGDSLRDDEFWANKDISFELRRGECLGLIGHNGAGKTTLLKMLNALIKPDEGTIEMRGRVGALIALGAGFNPILTGRENVYIAGSVLGLSKKEIDAKYDEIVEFAETEEFMDTPTQNYSSGMQVRLGFAVASSLEPDILIIDEVVAVGDVGFRTKCYYKINQLREKAAVIFVSHNMSQVARLCGKSILLKQGKVSYLGETSRAIDEYNAQFESEKGSWQVIPDAIIHSVNINGLERNAPFEASGTDPLSIDIDVTLPSRYSKVEVRVTFAEKSMELISQANSRFSGDNLDSFDGRQLISVNVGKMNFGNGVKKISLALFDAMTDEIIFWASHYWEVRISNEIYIPTPAFTEANFQVQSLS